jgi:hypothetical protein
LIDFLQKLTGICKLSTKMLAWWDAKFVSRRAFFRYQNRDYLRFKANLAILCVFYQSFQNSKLDYSVRSWTNIQTR